MFLLSPHVHMIESAVTCFRVLEHSTLDCNARTVCVAFAVKGYCLLKRKWKLGGTSNPTVKIARSV